MSVKSDLKNTLVRCPQIFNMEQRALGQGEINNLIVSYLYWQNRLVFAVKKNIGFSIIQGVRCINSDLMWNNYHNKICKNAVSFNIKLRCLVNIERGVDFLLCHSPYAPKFKGLEFTYISLIQPNLMNLCGDIDDVYIVNERQ